MQNAATIMNNGTYSTILEPADGIEPADDATSTLRVAITPDEMDRLKQSVDELTQHCQRLQTAHRYAERKHRQSAQRMGLLALATAVGSIFVVARSVHSAAAAYSNG